MKKKIEDLIKMYKTSIKRTKLNLSHYERMKDREKIKEGNIVLGEQLVIVRNLENILKEVEESEKL